MSKRLEARDVRDGYACNHIQDDLTGSEVYELFDQWFNEVRAEAWDEGLQEGLQGGWEDNPYKEQQ